jgi:uncharacterized protein (TIGR03437 family)
MFVLPAKGGLALNGSSFSAAGNYNFFRNDWEAPFLLFQGKSGGVNIYSTDTKSLTKSLTVSSTFQQTANVAILIEAPGPWKTATEAGPVQWRLAAYTGDWQSGARIYRDWHNAAVPPATLTGARVWAKNIRTVIEYGEPTPYNNSTLDDLAAVVNPAQTLLYLVDWRTYPYDVGYPDYNWEASVPSFIARAHALGFRVMLHTHAVGVSPASPDFLAVQQFQLKDPLNLTLQGWNWNLPASDPDRIAAINPAAWAWRELYRARITPAIQTLRPDAIHLDYSASFNDGNGLIGGMNWNQGFAQLEQDLLNEFPDLVLGIEQGFDGIAPWASFSQPLRWSSLGLSPATVQPLPVSAYALPNVTRYSHLGTTNPDTAGFISNLAQYEGQAVVPTLRSGIASYSQPDVARFMSVIAAFEKYNLAPAWDALWNGAVMKYQGTSGATATLIDNGSLIQFAAPSGVLYTRVHGVNQIDSPLSVPSWPAFSGSVNLGLDPSNQYWLDNTLRPATLFANVWRASAGVTYSGADFPLANGAMASLQAMTVGSVSRQGILCHPPWLAQSGGETFVEFSVPVPAGTRQLSFAAGILDSAQRQGPMTFKVEINGAIVWQQDVSTGRWQSGAVDMTSWAGRTVKIRFVTNPGPAGNPTFASGGWSALRLSSFAESTLNGIVIATPRGLTSSNVVTTGGTAALSSGNVTVNGLPPGGTVLLFTGHPAQLAIGQTLLTIPFLLAQGSNSQLATVGAPAFAGTGGVGPVSSGGVTKQALNGFGPPNGQTILSWLVHLRSASPTFSFSAGFWDDRLPPAPQGFQMSLRINGMVLWQRNINVPPAWEPGEIDLSPWSGQTVLIELITDTLGANYDNFTSWGELMFRSLSAAGCATTIPAATRTLEVDAQGSTTPVPVTVGDGCDWGSYSPVDWIAVTPLAASGSGTASIIIAPNSGPRRQSWVAVGGNVVNVSQAGASPQTKPEILFVNTVAGGAPMTAPNTWLTIRGTNLSATTRAWQQSDFVNGQMPVQLDNVSVSVNGKPAFVQYVSPGQINVLTQLDSTLGAIDIVVTSSGASSAPFQIPMRIVAPGFFLFARSNYVAATHLSGNLLGPTSLYPGATTPARPGEVVALYAGGFGQTAAQNGSLPLPLPVVTISDITADVQFAGAVSPGLYQFNIVIPASARDGDNPIKATYAGGATQSGALIFVQR